MKTLSTGESGSLIIMSFLQQIRLGMLYEAYLENPSKSRRVQVLYDGSSAYRLPSATQAIFMLIAALLMTGKAVSKVRKPL